MASTNDEAVETAHQVVAKREIRSNKRMTRNLTGPLKSLVNILQKSITYARGRIINFVCSGMILRKISMKLSRS